MAFRSRSRAQDRTRDISAFSIASRLLDGDDALQSRTFCTVNVSHATRAETCSHGEPAHPCSGEILGLSKHFARIYNRGVAPQKLRHSTAYLALSCSFSCLQHNQAACTTWGRK